MKRIRIVGLCLVAVFALSAVAASNAFATEAEEILWKLTGASTFPATFSGSAGATTLETLTGTKVTCTALTNAGTIGSSTEGEGKTAHLGLVHILFSGCTTKVIFTLKCQSGSEEGKILVLAPFHLGLAHLGSNLRIPAVIILIGHFNFECGGSKVEVTGNVIGRLLNGNGTEPKVKEPQSKAQLSFKQANGMQELQLILLPLGGGTVTGQLTSNSSLFGEHESGQEGVGVLEGFKNSKGESTELELVAG